MDDRDQPDINVVHLLRRTGEPDAERRRELSRTIFATEDDIGPFSQGNLVVPQDTAQDASATTRPEPDPFFDQYLNQPGNGDAELAEASGEVTDTAAYFDRMDASSPDELAAGAFEPAAASPLPGSAHLPPDLPRSTRARRAQIQPEPRRVARPAVLGAAAAFVIAGLAFAVVAPGGSSRAQHAGDASSVSAASLGAGRAQPPDLLAELRAGLAGARSTPAVERNTRTRHARHTRVTKPARVHHTRTANGTGTAARTVGARTTSQPAAPSETQAYTPPASSSGSSASTNTTSAKKQPAFGASGVLGPGSSPNG